ncbi:hypothetical protein ACTFQF_19130 [Aliivibrio fischeri]|uniref:Uncharacterized protein n=3 Tax=Aliivibrio fischeri TaxID=668 RepID=Q5E194_ALIF1|nr:hypothetical protein [Aliivibrio fischeri]AAW87202.1 hypothetical protein VF_A0132 [Aliivibrio fischeri ES114]ACH64402.1 conserved hypothetical protein [Aliivibrio fischeri MJ11]KLU80845.1 hypothetical protein AB192_03175 [Aliivibrio fischeri]MBP3139504.1 hypothetical protein [Aliivibrio fischeri]MBP3155094.1 hypothetical protein [Aliivibrio fischeri]
MKVEAVGKIQMESIEREKSQEVLKNSISNMKMQNEGVYDQQAINFALKRGEIKEQEIESRVNRLKIYMDKQRELNNIA